VTKRMDQCTGPEIPEEVLGHLQARPRAAAGLPGAVPPERFAGRLEGVSFWMIAGGY